MEIQLMQTTGSASMQAAQAKVEGQIVSNEAKRQGHVIDTTNKAEQLQFERQQRATAGEVIMADNNAGRQVSPVMGGAV